MYKYRLNHCLLYWGIHILNVLSYDFCLFYVSTWIQMQIKHTVIGGWFRSTLDAILKLSILKRRVASSADTHYDPPQIHVNYLHHLGGASAVLQRKPLQLIDHPKNQIDVILEVIRVNQFLLMCITQLSAYFLRCS